MWSNASKYYVVTTSVGFQKNIEHITASLLLSTAGTNYIKEELVVNYSVIFLIALDCILLDPFNTKLHVHSLDSHNKCILYAYSGLMRTYLGLCPPSMIELLVKVGNGWFQVTSYNYFSLLKPHYLIILNDFTFWQKVWWSFNNYPGFSVL